MAEYFVYILSNKSRMLYIGVTNNLERRVLEHQVKLIPGFTEHYGLTHLVYYESTNDINAAISREKEIKGWVRRKKTALINAFNLEWKDLSLELAPPHPDTLHFVQGDNNRAEVKILSEKEHYLA
jgi:putative endonuclease